MDTLSITMPGFWASTTPGESILLTFVAADRLPASANAVANQAPNAELVHDKFPMSAEEFFSQWYAWGVRCRLRPVIKVAKMLKRHLPNLLSSFRHRITNATSEGFNSVIQALKHDVRSPRPTVL